MLHTHYDFTNMAFSLLHHYDTDSSTKSLDENEMSELHSKFLEHFFHRLHTIRRKNLKAVLDNLWNMPAPTRPRQAFRSLEPLHPPHPPLQKSRLANLDILNQSQDPEHTFLQAMPSPRKRSNQPSQICDLEPGSLDPSKRGKDPCFEGKE